MSIYRMAAYSRATVIPHGNYIHIYENVIDKMQARKQLRLNTEDIVYLYFGQIRPYKGTLELIDTFRKLDAPRTELLIAGSPYNNEIVEDILKRCNKNENIKTILKFIPDDEIQIYMNASDIVALPYKDILTSGAVMLAMSFGKPIIAPLIGCIPDVLDNEGGLLYNPSDDNGLLEAMRHALDADLIKMGKHNLELAKQLQWDDIAKRTYKIYQECLTRETRQ
jgi:beta-1,4-mannosyltransferase